MKHEKLVRDGIPAIIRQSGSPCEVRVASHGEFLEHLHRKLDEEVAEFHEKPSIEELADILEVAYALGLELGVLPPDLERARLNKRSKRGGFEQRFIWLMPAGMPLWDRED